MGDAVLVEADPIEAARRLARDFARDASAHDREGTFPFANFDVLHAAGLLRLTVSRAAGGQGAGLDVARRVVTEVARGEPSTALVLAMHLTSHAAIARGDAWPVPLARRLTDSLRTGPALVNRLQVEHEAGSPSYGALPQTRAVRTEAGWRITGRKRYATGAPLLAWLVVSAVTDEGAPRLGSFVVPSGAPGVSIIETWDTIGMRATGSHDVAFDGVAVAADHAIELRPAAEGTRPDPFGSVWFMGLTGAVYDGIARAARDDAVSFARRFAPSTLGAPLSSVPHIQQAVGAMEVLLETNDRLLGSLAVDASAARPASTTAPLVRLVVIENAIRAVDLALEIAGNHGLAIGGALERLHRDVICGRTHPPGAALVRQTAAARILAEA